MNTELKGFRMVHINAENNGILWERRLMLGLTRQQVADRAGINVSQYYSFETGKKDLKKASFRIAGAVLKALGLDLVKYHHNEYTVGEEVYIKNGLRYKKTGNLVSEDIE